MPALLPEPISHSEAGSVCPLGEERQGKRERERVGERERAGRGALGFGWEFFCGCGAIGGSETRPTLRLRGAGRAVVLGG